MSRRRHTSTLGSGYSMTWFGQRSAVRSNQRRAVGIVARLAAIVVRQLRDRRVVEHAVEMAGQEIRIEHGGSPAEQPLPLIERASPRCNTSAQQRPRRILDAVERCGETSPLSRSRPQRSASPPRWRLAYRKLLAVVPPAAAAGKAPAGKA